MNRLNVSIHARVERATRQEARRRIHAEVSIHARVERATIIDGDVLKVRLMFQSTHA